MDSSKKMFEALKNKTQAKAENGRALVMADLQSLAALQKEFAGLMAKTALDLNKVAHQTHQDPFEFFSQATELQNQIQRQVNALTVQYFERHTQSLKHWQEFLFSSKE